MENWSKEKPINLEKEGCYQFGNKINFGFTKYLELHTKFTAAALQGLCSNNKDLTNLVNSQYPGAVNPELEKLQQHIADVASGIGCSAIEAIQGGINNWYDLPLDESWDEDLSQKWSDYIGGLSKKSGAS